MRILMIHNFYRQKGGEDMVVDQEARLLKDRGHQVHLLVRYNDEIGRLNPLREAAGTLWSYHSARRIDVAISTFRPHILHSHNTFPLISPSLYWMASRRGIPVIQTLHNFRLLCVQAIFLRDAKVCEDCLDKVPWRGALRACYRNSQSLSSLVMAMLCLHRMIGTYRRKVTQYIALNEFCRRKFIEGGLPVNRISIKPNFVDIADKTTHERCGFLFVGRLSPEKGVYTLAKASQVISDIKIKVIGVGPCQQELSNFHSLKMMGFLEMKEVQMAMSKASCLIVPSIWYEGFPRTIVEAYANGLPVIASRCGALPELVKDGQTGLLFEPGKFEDLARKIRWTLDHPETMKRMGLAARDEYEAKYTPAINYIQLMAIYEKALRKTKNDGA